MRTHKISSVGRVLLALLTAINLLVSSTFAQSTLVIEAVVLRDANLRAGPGVTHAIIGSAKAGQWVTVTDYAGDWYQLGTGEWIAKFLVVATAESRVVAFRLEDAPATANRNANLRDGPGTNYPIVRGVQAGQTLSIVGQNQAGDWFRLGDGAWIAAFLVNRIATGLPIVGEEYPTLSSTIPARPMVTPTTMQPTATPSTIPTPLACAPSYPSVCIPPYPPDLNCADIPYVDFPVIGTDPHGFDDNNDGIGCER